MCRVTFCSGNQKCWLWFHDTSHFHPMTSSPLDIAKRNVEMFKPKHVISVVSDDTCLLIFHCLFSISCCDCSLAGIFLHVQVIEAKTVWSSMGEQLLTDTRCALGVIIMRTLSLSLSLSLSLFLFPPTSHFLSLLQMIKLTFYNTWLIDVLCPSGGWLSLLCVSSLLFRRIKLMESRLTVIRYDTKRSEEKKDWEECRRNQLLKEKQRKKWKIVLTRRFAFWQLTCFHSKRNVSFQNERQPGCGLLLEMLSLSTVAVWATSLPVACKEMLFPSPSSFFSHFFSFSCL